MKLVSSTAIALVAGLVAMPAAAQGNYGATSTAPQQSAAQPAPAAPEAAKAQIKVSAKAAKAITELQKAVIANDVAGIPAKVAAAQAVAQTKEDRYTIGQLQLKAALAAKDNNAASAAVDAIAGSGYLEGGKVAELYDALGIELYNAKQYPQAAALFEKASGLTPQSP
jgi:tetratricopeptide (TPR) repeat protein